MPVWVNARDVPEIRAHMTTWARDTGVDGAANWFRFFLGPSPVGATESRVFDRVDDVGATIAGTLATQFPTAELFYVSADMTDLACHAADTLTDYRLHPEDLPAQVGVMVYEHPPVAGTASSRHHDVTVVSWGPGRGGLWVHTWAAARSAPEHAMLPFGRALAEAPHEQVLARARAAAARALPEPTPANKPSTDDETADQAAEHILATLLPNLERAPIPPSYIPPHGYEWCGLTPMEFTEMRGWPGGLSNTDSPVDTEHRVALQRTILATWLLMGQTLVRSDPVAAPRAARRRIERLDPVLDPTVRFIDLRRARTVSSDHPDESRKGTRDYRHRWIVRGHWRNQWYPSRNDHRPIRIAPHLAGPEDMPLLGGERVNVLRR